MRAQLALALAILLTARPALATERAAARLDLGKWVVAAKAEVGVDKICFTTGSDTIVCGAPVAVTAGEFRWNDRTYRVIDPQADAVVAAEITLGTTAQVRAIACRTQDGLELCSEPSGDVYALKVLQPTPSPQLIDLVQKIQDAAKSIMDSLEGR